MPALKPAASFRSFNRLLQKIRKKRRATNRIGPNDVEITASSTAMYLVR